ncbi:hypothetical protein BJ944DRAFT_259243 [Cunninghamella echinulata]|nr:hypothetical protein BJ944DRAFT_259243 [Cunninghamella echinulata]
MLSVNNMLNEDINNRKPSKLNISNLLCQDSPNHNHVDHSPSSLSPPPPYFSNSVASSPSSTTSSTISLPSIHSIHTPHNQNHNNYSYHKTTISNFYNHSLITPTTSSTSSTSHRFYNISDPILSPYDEEIVDIYSTKNHHPSSSLSDQIEKELNHQHRPYFSSTSTSTCTSTSSSPSYKNEEYYHHQLLHHDDNDYEHRHHQLIKSKRKRANTKQLEVLNRVFEKTFFPSTQLRAQLGRQLGMSPRTVQIWFQNKRQAIRNREK